MVAGSSPRGGARRRLRSTTIATLLITGLLAGVLAPVQAGAQESVEGPVIVVPSVDGKIVYQSNAAGDHDVWVMDGDGTDQRKLTQEPANLDKDDGQPSIAGAATRITFASCRDANQLAPCALGDIAEVLGNSEIYAMKPDGSGQTRLTNNTLHDGAPVFSPDGSKIAFVSLRDTNANIFVMNPDGTNQTRLTTSLADDWAPTWSPDGRKIAFVSARDGDPEIFVMNADGTGQTQLTSNTVADIDPDWSNDGTEIAFASNRDGDMEIYVRNAPGLPASATQLTFNGSQDTEPAWSPKGNALAYVNDTGGDPEIYLMNADGTSPRQVTDNTSVDRSPDWVENVTVTADRQTTQASPGSIPVSRIPLTAASPYAKGVAGDSFNLDSIGLGGDSFNLDSIGLGGDSFNLDSIGLGGDSFNLDSIGLGTLEALDRVPLSSIPIVSGPPTWEDVLRGTAYAGWALHTVSYGELARAADAEAPTLADVRLAQLDLTEAPFSSVRFDALVLGTTRWRDIVSPFADGWCPRFEALGFANCGEAFKGLDGTPLHAQIAGLPFADPNLPVPLQAVALKDVTLPAGAPVSSLLLQAFDLGVTQLGSVAIGALANPAAVVDCTRVDCSAGSTQTLYDASRLVPSAILAGATLGQVGAPAGALALGEIVLALTRLYPIEAIPYDKLGIRGWTGTGSNPVVYDMRFAPVGISAAASPTVTMTFPDSFAHGRSQLIIGNGAPVAVTPSATSYANGLLTVTWKLTERVAAGSAMRMKVTMLPGTRLGGSAMSVRIEGADPKFAELREGQAPVTVTDTFEANGIDQPTPIEANTLYTSFTLHGDEDHFALPAPPEGALVTFILGHQDIDRDLTVLFPQDAPAIEPLRQPKGEVRELALVPDEGVGFDNTATPLQPDGINVPLPDGRRVAGISQNRGTANEYVSAVSPGGSGTFLVKVSRYNDAVSASPYTLRVRVTLPRTITCAPATFAHDADPYAGADEAASLLAAPSSLPAGTETLIVFPHARWADTFGLPAAQAVKGKLDQLAAHPKVRGAVIPVDGVPAVRDAYAAWDADPCDIDAGNDVVRAANAYIDGLLDDPSGLTPSDIRHVVMVGDHLMTPMGAVHDLTEWGNESTYTQSMPYTAGNGISAASAKGFLLTDDPWAETDPEAVPGGWLYAPDWAAGRLVEDTADVTAAVDAFLGSNGVLDPKTGLSAGTDFMKDLGTKVQDQNKRHLTSSTGLVSDSWTLDDLRNAVLGTSPADVVAIQAHSDGYRTLPPASPPRPMSTADIAAGGPIGKIWFSMGCHTGEQRPDRTTASATAAYGDWADTLASRAAVFLGQTGYGLGGRYTYDLSEPIVGSFGDLLLKKDGSGRTSVTAGQALAVSKQLELVEDGVPGVYTTKALEEATLYGLPMYQVGASSTRADSVGAAMRTARPGSEPVLQPDSSTGLSYADVTTTPNYELVLTPEGRYYKASGHEPQNTHYRPVLPKMSRRVTSSLGTARGVTIESYATTEIHDFDPLIFDPLTAAGAGIEHPGSERGDIQFPTIPAKINSGPDGETLVTMLGHFAGRTLQDGQVRGRLRRVNSATWRVWYSNDPDITPPTSQSFEVTTTGSAETGFTAHISARVTDDEGVARVSAGVLDESGAWRIVQLARDASDPALFTADLPFQGPGIEVFGQAVDTAANSIFITNKAVDFAGFEQKEPGTYDFDGPYSPYLGKTVQAGSTVPIKWRLYLDGVPVTDPGAVSELWSYRVNCTTREPVAGTAATKEDLSLLQVDPVTLEYHYNWRTSPALVGACAMFEIALDDGSLYPVFFRFKN